MTPPSTQHNVIAPQHLERRLWGTSLFGHDKDCSHHHVYLAHSCRHLPITTNLPFKVKITNLIQSTTKANMKLATHLMLATTATATALNPFLGSLGCNPGNPGAVYYCSNANFGGDCIYRPANDDCFAPPSAPMSIGPDKGGVLHFVRGPRV